MKRKATARWQGNLQEGNGKLSTQSGALSDTPYSFAMRFENTKGTNPEELIAAAHAGCFAMALSAELQKAKLVSKTIDVEASVNLEKIQNSWSINGVHLVLSADIPKASQSQFDAAAESAKLNCPISKVLKAAITLESSLVEAELDDPLGL